MVSSNTLYTIGKYTLGLSLSIPVVLAGALWVFQRRLIYPADFPEGSRKHVPRPTDAGLPYEDVTITTPDKVRIKAYVIPARKRVVPLESLRGLSAVQMRELGKGENEAWEEVKDTEDAIEYVKSRPTIVMFHANAGNVGHRIPLARKFVSELNCNVFMLSYRGYGLSEGTPSEHGIRIDAGAAMEFLSQHPLLKDTKFVVYGQSIGGAVCLDTAAAYPDMVSGVIVENTFLSLTTLVPHVMPVIPKPVVSLLLSDPWDATKTLPLIPKDTPILFLSGKQDQLVPQPQMLALRKLRGDGKYRWREFDGTHNDTYLAPAYWSEIDRWLKQEVEGEGDKEAKL
ncbi:Protein bem46 [Vanrija pseudolonga]|uniref:Protein bem46 n=1 Tax=Vanrija pseudolonga TaxID=143232 RepID=A0AAF1BHA5_9TREE|nr:Protein bem46 [Vanrija pseudolonga]